MTVPAPNDRLVAARTAARLTQAALADLANAQVERDTGACGAMDADYVSKLERGVHRWPNRQYRAALRTVLGRASDDELGFFSARARAVTVSGDPRREDGGDVDRKTFLRVLAGSVAGAALSDPLAEFVGGGADAQRTGIADADQVRRLARMFAAQDHTFGGGLSSDAAVAQLRASASLLDARFTGDGARARIFSAVADMADVAGGMCFDAGSLDRAERCFRFAAGCATEAGDWPMRAKALSGLANLAVHQERPDDALSYAEMALVRCDRLSPIMKSVIHSRHARALGLHGADRESDCRAAADRAEAAFAASTGDEPDWIAYYSAAHLERDLGRAMLHVALTGGDHRPAARHLTAAVASFPDEPSRGKALAMANLALLTMTRDDPCHAAALGHAALDAVGPIRSTRVDAILAQLTTASLPHQHLPDVRLLLRRASAAHGS